MSAGIYSYVRVSTKRQRDSATIEDQRAAIAEYCGRNGITDVREFADDGVTSRKPFMERPGSGELFREAEAGRVREILCYAINRLGRDADSVDTQATVHQLWKLGVKKIISMRQGVLEDTTDGHFLLGIHCSVGGYERDTLAYKSRTSSRRLAKATDQFMGGIRTFGYQQEGEERNARLVVDDSPIPDLDISRMEVVRRIYDRFDRGDTYEAVANYVGALGVPGRWPGNRIKEILRNPTYMGERYWGKRAIVWDKSGYAHLKPVPRDKWIKQSCPPIIDESLWMRVNARIDRLARAAKAHQKRDYPLSGLLTCGVCSRAYIGATTTNKKKGTELRYYRCISHYGWDRKTNKCTSPTLHALALDAAIWEHVGEFLARPGVAIKELRRKQEVEGLAGQTVADELRKLDKQREKLVQQKRRVLTQFGQGLFSDDDVRREVERLDAEMAALDRVMEEKNRISAHTQSAALQLDFAGRLLGDLRDQLRKGELTFEQKRRFIETLVGGITINANGTATAEFRFDGHFKRSKAHVSESLYGHACK